LRKLGITKSRSADVPIWVLIALLVAAAGVLVGAAFTHSLSGDVAIAGATAVITVAGLLVAVLQWRAGLAEKALDALYQRITLANKMRLSASDAAESINEDEIARKEPDNYRFFVFTEIDSLEYAAVRYRFGLGMTDLIARRAVDHFMRRCEERTFLETAHFCIDDGAYLDYTKKIVPKIFEDVEKRKAEKAARARTLVKQRR